MVETVHMTFSTCLGQAYTKYCPLASPNTTECFGVSFIASITYECTHQMREIKVNFSRAISVEDDSHPYAHTEANYIYTGIMPVLFHLNYNGNRSLLHSHMGLIKISCGVFYSYSKAEDHICNVMTNARLPWQCLSDAGPYSPVILDPSTVQLLASPHINLKVKIYGMGHLKLMRHFLVFNIIDEHATRHCFSFPGAQVHGWFHTENTDIVVMKTSQIPFLP